jgi:hypothetical protein
MLFRIVVLRNRNVNVDGPDDVESNRWRA